MAALLLYYKYVFVIGCKLSNSLLAPRLPPLQLRLGLNTFYVLVF